MFAKVFTQILDSSLAEDYQVRLVFEDLLKLADSKGIVDMTRESIARRTNVPLELVRRGIDQLEKPDPSSRTPDYEGRRIIRLDEHRDWGWRIVNFTKYRESATKAMLRMAESERKAEWRKRKGFPPSSPIPKEKQSTEAEAEQSRLRPGLSGTCPGQKKPTMYELRSSIEAKESQCAELKYDHCTETGLSTHWDNDEAKRSHSRLIKEIKELRGKIAAFSTP